MNKISIKESHINQDYADGYSDGEEIGTAYENKRIRDAVIGYDANYELEKHDDSEVDENVPLWVDGFNSAKKLFINVIENGV